MALSQFELYHGAVLTQIVRNPGNLSLKLIERDSEKHGWGMYAIGAGKKDYILVVKSTARITEGRKIYCNFTFSVEDINLIKKYKNKELLIALVCHKNHICLLTKSDVISLTILESDKSCRLSVYWTRGSGLTVKSTFAELDHKISRNTLKNFQWK